MVTKTEKIKSAGCFSFKKGTKIDFDLYFKTLISLRWLEDKKKYFLALQSE